MGYGRIPNCRRPVFGQQKAPVQPKPDRGHKSHAGNSDKAQAARDTSAAPLASAARHLPSMTLTSVRRPFG